MRLRVRYGKYGQVTSPTTATGHLGYVLLLLAFDALWLVALSTRNFDAGSLFAALGLGYMSWVVGRDALAWFAASPEERQAFASEVETLRQRRTERLPQSGGVAAPLLVASLMFGVLGWLLASVSPALVVLPLVGWAYVLVRVMSERQRGP